MIRLPRPFPLLLFLLAPTPEPDALPVEIATRVEKIAPSAIWPGFDPSRVPLAIFDGDRTLLFRHPAPPAEFAPLSGRPSVRVAPGQHPLVRANTSVTLGGVDTATLVLDRPEPRPARELAAIAVHEAFHVYQGQRHPKWGGNEVDLFTYPVDDPALLQLSRLEAEALRRALSAKRERESACWTAAALDVRRRRFASLGEAGAAYERGTELKEGLARLVESRALGGPDGGPIFPRDEFPAGEVRSRSYALGHAFGALLDRFASGWEKKLGDGATPSLDALLADAVTVRAGARLRRSRLCAFSRAESDRALAGAQRSVELAAMTREAVRRDFLARPGWTVVVTAPEPLSPERFDPLNVERLGPGEVLHTRWVKLGNPAGSIEVLNARALTEAAGAHPLFEGVRRVTVTGLRQEPDVTESSGAVTVRSAGLSAEFRGARISREGRTITISLPERR